MTRERVEFRGCDRGRKLGWIGKDAWPFPVPLTKGQLGWVFDLQAGRDEGVLSLRPRRGQRRTEGSGHATAT